jgi:hypothetical protein
VRLYVVAERRLVTFVKDLVRVGLVPSRLETWWCAQHAVVMQPWHNAQGIWYSHQRTEAPGAPAKRRPPTPTPQPHTTHSQGGPHESLSLPHTGPTLHGSRRMG